MSLALTASSVLRMSPQYRPSTRTDPDLPMSGLDIRVLWAGARVGQQLRGN
jgi:hypothetical protein